MRRREFVTLLGGAAVLGCPRGAPGQPRDRMRRIGVISYENENDADERELRDQFTARLRELGWIEGSNLHTIIDLPAMTRGICVTTPRNWLTYIPMSSSPVIRR
jgi:hypothetical protein